MALLSLVQSSEGRLALHSNAPSKNADFSIFDLDGGGSGDPFGYGSTTWTNVQGVEEVEYDEDDTDSFWQAHQVIIDAVFMGEEKIDEHHVDCEDWYWYTFRGWAWPGTKMDLTPGQVAVQINHLIGICRRSRQRRRQY